MGYQQVAGFERPGRGLGQDDETSRMLADAVASVFDVRPECIASAGRGPAPVAAARQLAIYLACTRLGFSFTVAGRLFGRDRTTAAHACRRVEDMRDDERMDALVEGLEQQLSRRLGLPGAAR